MLRIAGIVGLSTAALYRYFDSRETILMATYDKLADRVQEWIRSTIDLDDPARFWEHLSRHSRLFSADVQGFNAPMFQFRVYLPDDVIRRHVRDRTADMFTTYETMVEDAKARGFIRRDVDARSVVMDLLAWMYWESMTYLSGLADESTPVMSDEMLLRIRDRISVTP